MNLKYNMKTTTEELILKLFNEGIEKKLIQKKVKKTRQYVMFILKKHGLTSKRQVDKIKIAEDLKKGFTTQEVARINNCHIDTVYKVIRHYDLKKYKVVAFSPAIHGAKEHLQR
jgi:DNA invertase Pin-like site-specific DNA recombinase